MPTPRLDDSDWRPVPRKKRVKPTYAPVHGNLPDALSALEALPSKASKRLRETLGRLARHPTISILLEGESGVGKSFLARAIHQLSPRAAGPFIEQDLTAIRGDLAIPALFGHVRGAYTGANGVRAGAFVSAQHGTLFLDELGKTEIGVQALLLRAVEKKLIQPLGSDRHIAVDVRCVFASNRSLDECMKADSFLPDLAARLENFVVRVPPLRERGADIPPLIRLAVASTARELSLREIPRVSDELYEFIKRYEWPNNVRELVHVFTRIVIEADGASVLRPEHIPETSRLARLRTRRRGMRLPAGAAAAAVAAVDDGRGRFKRAAEMLQCDRTTVYRQLKKERPQGS